LKRSARRRHLRAREKRRVRQARLDRRDAAFAWQGWRDECRREEERVARAIFGW
jgi:hypothetical protein